MRLLTVFLLILLPCSLAAQGKGPPNPHVAATPPLRPEEQLKTFHLPPGFVIELVAADPDVKKPININFDVKGRLWVTGSEEYPFPAPMGRKPKDTVKVLEDFAADGRARKIATFADGLNIPIGVQPLADGKSALVYSIPSIYLMTDTDGDGKADERRALYSGYGFKDTHGMTGEFQLWLDGWIYCCHGFANQSHVKGKEGAVSMQSGNTYRIKPDGSRIEQFTWGQVNPFGLTFDPRGLLYSADCHTRPLYQLIRGASYPSFGKPHDGMGFGPEMVQHDHGSTAISGIAYYADDHFPADFQDNIFVGNVVTNRINRDTVEWHGASPKGSAMPDFLVCDDPWFRPVDIKLGPDGALYVADFYNRIIGHYEVPLDHPGRDREKGRIWRIRYAGKDGKNALPPMVDLTTLETKELVKQLSRPNLTARMLATQALVARSEKDVDRLLANGLAEATDDVAVCAMWVLERRANLSEGALTSLHARDGLVRSHVLKLLAERPSLTEAWRKIAVADLKDKSPFVQRAAAEALTLHPSNDMVRPLLDLRHAVAPQDTHLLHVVRLALRAQLKLKGAFELDPTGWPEKDFRALADVCLGVHTPDGAAFLQGYLETFAESPLTTLAYVHHVVRFGKDDAAHWAFDFARAKHMGNLGFQAKVLATARKARQERGGGLGAAELAGARDLVEQLLAGGKGADVETALDLAGDLKLSAVSKAVMDLVGNPKADEALRRRGVVALLNIDPAAPVPFLVNLLSTEATPKGLREQVAGSLAATNRSETHQALVKAMETAPASVQGAIAFALAGSPPGAEQLLRAVGAGKASPRLLTDPGLARRLEETRLPNLKERLAELTKGFPAADARALEQQSLRRKGFLAAKTDAAHGQLIFTKHCAACHQIGGAGAKVGPQLDGVGIRGVDRLLEDILDPNRNIDQAFRASLISLKGGQVYNGLVIGKEGKVVVLIDNLGKEVRVSEADIDEQRVLNISPMPATFFENIPEPDFHDLLAYLLDQRPK